MSDILGPRGKALDEWRDLQARARQAAAVRADVWIGGAASVLLIVTLLYKMIGPTPYSHELLFDPLTGGSQMSAINRNIWLTLLAFSVPILILKAQDVPQLAKRVWPVLLLLCWFAASTTWALDPDASRRRVLFYFVALIVSAAVRLGLPDGRRAHTALAWACAIMIAIDLFSWILLPAQSMTDIGLAAIHNHKNTLGLVMLFACLVLGPYILSRPTGAGRWAWGAVLAGGVALLVASLSKTSIAIAAVTALVTPLLLMVLSLRAALLRTIAAGAAVLVGGLLFAWFASCAIAGSDPLGPIKQLNFTHRTDVWQFVLQQFSHHPLGGFGFGSFWDIDPALQPSKQTDLWFGQPDAPTNEAHNGYLDLLVTTGLPGLLGALLLLFGWIWRGLSMIRAVLLATDAQVRAGLPYALYLGLFTIICFVHNWMESSFFTPDATFGVIILLVGVEIDTRGPRQNPLQKPL